MSNTEIWNRLTLIFRRVFRKPDLQVAAETTAWDISGWDSIAHMQLILGIEEEFGIQFEIHEVAGIEKAGEFVKAIVAKSAAAK